MRPRSPAFFEQGPRYLEVLGLNLLGRGHYFVAGKVRSGAGDLTLFVGEILRRHDVFGQALFG